MLMWCKKHKICEKYYIWNPPTCSCENDKCLANIVYDSVIMHNEIIDPNAKSYNEETETIPKHIIYETKFSYISVAFLFITILLLIVVSISCGKK